MELEALGRGTRIHDAPRFTDLLANGHADWGQASAGVIGQIIPCSLPLTGAVGKMAPALASGSTIVLKPAAQASLAVIRLGELMQDAGFPPGVVNIITGDDSASAILAAHPHIDTVAGNDNTTGPALQAGRGPHSI